MRIPADRARSGVAGREPAAMDRYGAHDGGRGERGEYRAGLPVRPDDPPDMVVHALETLASRAHNRLQTGWEVAVRRQWPAAFQVGGDSNHEEGERTPKR